MEEFAHIFEGVVDPRRSNATLHELDEMLMIGLLSALSGGEGCADMERFGRAKEGFLRGFMRLAHGIPSRDALTNPFDAPDPGGLRRAMLRLAEGRAAGLGGGVTAIDGKALRRSFPAAASRSPPHPVRAWAFGGEVRPVLGQVRVERQVERDCGNADAVGDTGAEGRSGGAVRRREAVRGKPERTGRDNNFPPDMIRATKPHDTIP